MISASSPGCSTYSVTTTRTAFYLAAGEGTSAVSGDLLHVRAYARTPVHIHAERRATARVVQCGRPAYIAIKRRHVLISPQRQSAHPPINATGAHRCT